MNRENKSTKKIGKSENEIVTEAGKGSEAGELTKIDKATTPKKKISRRKKIVVSVIVFIIFLILSYFANNYIVISDYTFKSEEVSAELEGFRIVQISDLHNASFGADNKRLISKVKDCNPDIIVITGDIVDVNHTDIGTALAFAKRAVEICPVYYVTGNHEIWLSEEKFDELILGLKEAGVTVLDDECVKVTRGNGTFWLAGLRDTSLDGGKLEKLIEDKEGFTVALAHEPQYLEKYSKTGVDLVLAGHAHGGQVRLPFIGGLYAPDQGAFPKYTAGSYKKDNTEMIVSRGLGNSVLPLRVFNHPEVVMVELKSK